MARTRPAPLPVFGREGRLRDRFHSPAGARLVNAVTLPLWSVLAPSGFGILTTVGRRSGKPRRCSVRAIVRGRTAYLVSIAGEQTGWVRNVRAEPRVTLKVKGGRVEGVVRDVLDDAEHRAAMDAFCGTVNPMDYFECFLHRRGLPSRTKIHHLHRRWFDQGLPLVVELAPPA